MDNTTKVFREVLQDGSRAVVIPANKIPKKYWNRYDRAWSVTVGKSWSGALEIKTHLPPTFISGVEVGGLHKGYNYDNTGCWACIPESFWEFESNELGEYSL